MSQTIDVSGLPESAVQQIQQFVCLIRQNSTGVRNGTTTPDKLSNEEWIARFRAWTSGHPTRAIEIDDSRETIYEGYGE